MKHVRRFWLILVLGAAGFFAFQYKGTLVTSLPAIQQIGFGWLALAGCLQLAYWFVSSAAWRHLLHVNNVATVSLWNAFLQLAAVNVGKYLPGKVWGMVMRGGLLKRVGASVSEVVGATLQEQYLLLIAAALAAGLFAFALVPQYAALAAVLGIAILGLGFFLQRFCFNLLRRWVSRRAVSGANVRAAANASPAAISLDARSYGTLAGYYGVGWLLNGLVVAALYVALFPGTLGTIEDTSAIIVANTVGITIGFFAIFAPSGIGVREGVTAWLLGQRFAFDQAIIVTVFFRLWLVAIDLAFIAILGYVETRRKR